MLTKKIILLAVLLVPGVCLAAEEGAVPLDSADTDIHDVASLQRGARNFVNYCMGCHTLKYLRWNRMASDLGISEDDLKQYLITDGAKPFAPMTNAMSPKLAEKWFGKAPPDLSLIARARGTDYLYTFLRSFYADPSRPTGVNNLVLPNAAMPDVLANLQGVQKPKIELITKGNKTEKHVVGLEPGTPGSMTPEQFDGFVRDTVNFLDYAGEPIKATRERLGVWVMLFLLVFWGLTYLLKKEYWKDIK